MGERNNEEETPYDHGDRGAEERGVRGVKGLCALKRLVVCSPADRL